MRSAFGVCLAGTLALFGCSKIPRSVPELKADLKPCDEEIDTIVMRKVRHAFTNNTSSDVQFGSVKMSDLEHEQECIDSTRKWAKSLDDRCLRASYESWLDVSQYNLDEAKEELIRHTEEEAYESRMSERAQEEEKIRQYQDSHPNLPQPPPCPRVPR